MKSKWITAVGSVFTLGYVSLLVYFAWGNIKPPEPFKLNEMGDFLGGSFGPLAFIWLVCGYFQQGIELKQNTQALELQAAELKNSVEQQRELVEVTRAQMQAELSALMEGREAAKRAAQPRFVIDISLGVTSGDLREYRVSLSNSGATVSAVQISFDRNVPWLGARKFPIWKKEHSDSFAIRYASENQIRDFKMSIGYEDSSGTPGVMNYLCEFPKEFSNYRHVRVSAA